MSAGQLTTDPDLKKKKRLRTDLDLYHHGQITSLTTLIDPR